MPHGDGRSILLVAQLSPPSPLIAARRIGGMTKYLSRLGHSVTVLTSKISGTGSIEGAADVIRTADLMASPLNWRRGHFEALTGGVGLYRAPSRLESVVVPDLAVVSWLPFALRSALALSRHSAFDCVITSSPPQSVHVVGATLQRRRDLAWIAELRDGWTFEPPRDDWPLALQRRLDRALERRFLGPADAVVGVTNPIVVDAAARLGVEAHLITNGFDPEETAEPKPDPLLMPDRHSFVYTGRAGVAGRRLEPLLDALRLLQSEDPDLAEHVEVVFAGPMSGVEAHALADPQLAGLVRAVGPLERKRVLELQRAADCLLVLTRGTGKSEATGKLFEYLAAGTPILVLGEHSEAARIVAETGAGFATSAADTAAIAEALRRLVEMPPAPPSPEAVARYEYPRLAAQLAELIERVCRQ